jgi:hypothetical protein
MAFERVYTVWDYYDGPRSGVADYSGKPHHYVCEWDPSADDYAETFVLNAIDKETLSLVLEQWRIWRDWELAFHRGERAQETHPKLPGQDKRYAELDGQINARLSVSSGGVRVRGTFRARANQLATPGHAMRELEVEWTNGT